MGSSQPFAAGLFAAAASPMTVVNQQANLLVLPAAKEIPFVVAVDADADADAAAAADADADAAADDDDDDDGYDYYNNN